MKWTMPGARPGRDPGERPGPREEAGPLPVETSGLAVGALPDGRLRATLERLVLRNLRLQAGAGAVDIAQLTLGDAVATLAPSDAGFELRGLAAETLELQGVQVTLDGTAACALPPSSDPWRLDALGGLEGTLHAFVTDAAWILDAGVSLPVTQGRLDFNRVVVEHVGPNSSMGISPAGVYVDARRVGRTYLYLFTDGRVPGASFEQRGTGFGARVTDRGRLDLQNFVQGLLDAGSPEAFGRTADRHVEATLDRTRLNGELRLGDGALGTARHHLLLDGQARGRNRLQISAAVLGHKLLLRLPELSASAASFELLGLPGSTGALSACVEVQASELRGTGDDEACGPALHIEIDRMTVDRLRLGEEAGDPLPAGPAAAPG